MKPKAKNTTGTNLSERAMLVNLSIAYWEGRRKNAQVSKEVKVAKKADEDSGAWWTRTIPPNALKPLFSVVNKGRLLHQQYTLPWNDSGTRILPATMFLTYTKAMREVQQQYQAAVDAFLNEYPAIVERAQERLGDLFVADHYPSVTALHSKFGWTIQINPLPASEDFRVDLGSEHTEEIRKSIEDQVNQSMQAAMSDLWGQLYTVIEKVAERLNDTKNVFRDSLIGNVVELCDLLPKLNVTNDPALDKMRKVVLEKIGNRKPEELRTNEKERESAAKAASDILEKMNAFLGKKG